MQAENKEMADELAYVRSLAEEGRNAPLVGGLIYVIWGGLIGSAALFQFATSSGLVALPAIAGWAPWIIAFGLGWVLSLLVGRRTGGKPGALTIGNRTAASVWFAVGLFITGFWFTLLVVHDNFAGAGVPSYFLFTLMFPVAFGLYGVAFYASATAARLNWLRWFAYAAWVFSFVSLFLLDSSFQMLVAAVGSITCAVVPGLMLMRREPSEIV